MTKKLIANQPTDAQTSIKDEEEKTAPRRVFKIITEGKVSEPDYFTHSIRQIIDEKAQATVNIYTKHSGEYERLVQYAQECEKKSKQSGVEYWIIADTESRREEDDFLPLIEWAKKEHHHLGISNLMFEVWVLMHKPKTVLTCSSKRELWTQMTQKINENKWHWNEHNKHLDKITFLEKEVRDAIQRSRAQRKSFQSHSDDKNPPIGELGISTVDLLVEQLISDSNNES